METTKLEVDACPLCNNPCYDDFVTFDVHRVTKKVDVLVASWSKFEQRRLVIPVCPECARRIRRDNLIALLSCIVPFVIAIPLAIVYSSGLELIGILSVALVAPGIFAFMAYYLVRAFFMGKNRFLHKRPLQDWFDHGWRLGKEPKEGEEYDSRYRASIVYPQIDSKASSRAEGGMWATYACIFKLAYSKGNDVWLEGRASESEYRKFMLANLLVYVGILVTMAIAALVSGGNYDAVAAVVGFGALGFIAYCVAELKPFLMESVRRVHDVNLSGWLILLVFVLGPLSLPLLLLLMFLKGTPGENRYGANPMGC